MLHRLFSVLWIFALAFAVMAFVNVDRANAETALASWYGPGFEGLPTASGEPYDPSGYTAASKTLPLGTELIVSYQGNSVPVTINDRGPYVGSRDLDLSQAAAQTLGLDQAGVDYVDYQYADSTSYAPTQTTSQATYTEPAPEPAATEPAPTSSGYETTSMPQSGGAYVVQPGDTLSEIALQLGTTTEYLASNNGVADPDYIQSGQTIYY